MRALAFGAAVLLLAGCATKPAGESALPEGAPNAAAPVNDPLEPFNRGVHRFNEAVDKVALRPIARGYREYVPGNVRLVVRSALRNLKSPVILANDTLQGEWDRAWNTFMRLLINTTLGLGGIADVATEVGFPYHEEDFGQTLAVHGVDEGPYLVLPIIGPSNPRDTVGLVVDWFFDPFRYYTATQNPAWDSWALETRTGATVVDSREALLDPIDEIERMSLDTYVGFRSTYRQRRAAAIANAEDGGPAATTPMIEGSAFDFPEDEAEESPTGESDASK